MNEKWIKILLDNGYYVLVDKKDERVQFEEQDSNGATITEVRDVTKIKVKFPKNIFNLENPRNYEVECLYTIDNNEVFFSLVADGEILQTGPYDCKDFSAKAFVMIDMYLRFTSLIGSSKALEKNIILDTNLNKVDIWHLFEENDCSNIDKTCINNVRNAALGVNIESNANNIINSFWSSGGFLNENVQYWNNTI